MSVAPSVWVGAQIGGRLILLICESCRRPLEDASVSGRVTYSYTVHTEGGSGSSSRFGGVKGGDLYRILLRAILHLNMYFNWEVN